MLDIKNADIYVTGSNSKMLSTDVMTEFKDRGDEIHVNPLMYKEFYAAYKGDKNHAWQEFVTYGGLPRVMALKSDKDKSQYLQDLIRKTYLTDVIERNHTQKDISVLDDLLNIVASSIGSLTGLYGRVGQDVVAPRHSRQTEDKTAAFPDNALLHPGKFAY